jgi:PKD repeat protein
MQNSNISDSEQTEETITVKLAQNKRGQKEEAAQFSEEIAIDVESDSSVQSLNMSRSGKLVPSSDNATSDADSDEIITPRARRLRHLSIQSPTEMPFNSVPDSKSDQEYEGILGASGKLEEEYRDLTSSARKTVIDHRMRDDKSRNKIRSRYQKNLEMLRGKSTRSLQTESEEDTENNVGLYDTASDIESVPSDDFVVEDEDPIAVEEMEQIPPEFTTASTGSFRLNFKIMVQAEVYAVLHPDFKELDYSGQNLELRAN